jgi:hypothetical protein
MELKSFAWFIYILLTLLALVIICFIIMFTIKCLQTCVHNRTSLCCIKRSRTSSQSNANTNNNIQTVQINNNISNRLSDTYSSVSSTNTNSNIEYEESDEFTNSNRQTDNIHDNFAFISDYDISNNNSNHHSKAKTISSIIINRKYDDPSRLNNIRTISSCIDQACCSINIPNRVFTFQNDELDDNQSFQIDLNLKNNNNNSNSNKVKKINNDNNNNEEENSIISNLDLNSDEIPPKYSEIITGE